MSMNVFPVDVGVCEYVYICISVFVKVYMSMCIGV